MTRPTALLDSNVVIAMLAASHEHHDASLALLTERDPALYVVAAHSYAEAYATLTRPSGPFQFRADEAWAALASLRAVTTLAGLSPAQGFEVLRGYAASGGVGARLYDALIGEVAMTLGLATIVTWNTRHLAGLFPVLNVVTPPRFLEAVQG